MMTGKTATAEGSTRLKILDIAEQLFAEKGVDAVSLRAINAACDVSPGVLHYHFGNRSALLTAILLRRMDPLMALRRQRIEQLLARPEVSAEQLIRLLVEPLADFVGAGGHAYIRLISRLYADNHPVFTEVSSRYSQQGNQHIPALFSRACPWFNEDEIISLLGFSNNCMLQSLAQLGEQPKHWQAYDDSRPDDHTNSLQVDRLIAFLSRAFQQP